MDLDGDGWASPEDCDDSDAAVHPEADEVPYNGVDEDCDGEDLLDVDGDGWEAWTVGGEDCRDGNAAVHPDAVELCNGADEDCDEAVDEGLIACEAPVDPGDPGGLAWSCAMIPMSSGSWGLIVAAWVCARRLRSR
ncbi:MAG: putative metal-binding motif-containing protein [Alphaproteobacteria bacterium]|nr:putative metal-binding motif-containing protein [Alphaproteobacteria bacterium]